MFWVGFRSGAYGFRGLLWLCLGMAVLFTVSIGPFLAYSGYPGRVRRLESAVKKLKRIQKGENEMSKLINSLIGQECKLTLTDEFSSALTCRVKEADDDWLRVLCTDKKGHTTVKLLRIENVKGVELLSGGRA